MAWLTWQGLRALATCEVLTPHGAIWFAEPDLSRPPIKWTSQHHWFESVTHVTPEPGAVLFARNAWRQPWRTPFVQALQVPAVLVSAYYDPMVRGNAAAQMFAPGSQVQHWFAVQAQTTHPQLTAVPVGVEPCMVPVLADAERRSERDILCYLNFNDEHHFLQLAPIRPLVRCLLGSRPWVTVAQDLPLGAYAADLGRAKFVLSPPGYGWDCYRTYEAIAMGAIPIVQRTALASDVCAGLPVLLVDDWREVTPERLRREWEMRSRAPALTTMTMRYWRDRIQATAKEIRRGHCDTRP